jgi:hypothetical protein
LYLFSGYQQLILRRCTTLNPSALRLAIGRAAYRCGTAIEEFGSDHAFKCATERVARFSSKIVRLAARLGGLFFFRLHFSAYDLAQNAMREKQAMRKIMKTTFSIVRMYRSDKCAAR